MAFITLKKETNKGDKYITRPDTAQKSYLTALLSKGWVVVTKKKKDAKDIEKEVKQLNEQIAKKEQTKKATVVKIDKEENGNEEKVDKDKLHEQYFNVIGKKVPVRYSGSKKESIEWIQNKIKENQ